MKKQIIPPNGFFWLFLCLSILLQQEVLAQRIFSANTSWVPFNTARFHGYSGESRHGIGFYFPGEASLLQIGYSFVATQNLRVGLGVGYPFISLSIEGKLLTIQNKDFSIRFFAGFNNSETQILRTMDQWKQFFLNPFIGRVEFIYDLKKAKEVGHSIAVNYTAYSGAKSGDILPGTYPGSKNIFLNFSSYKQLRQHVIFNYSFGVGHVRILYDDEGNFANYYDDHGKPLNTRGRLAWNAGFGFTIHF